SSVYGYGDGNGRITQLCVEGALRGEPVVLHDGGNAMLDFTHVSDAADGFALAALRPEADGNIFNLTRGRARSVAEFAEAVRKLCPGMRVTAGGKPDTSRPKRGALSVARARRTLGYDPKIDIEEGVALYVKEAMGDPDLQAGWPSGAG
ncbi:MAG: NAD-dependent epimerase/dehydratase family protein, partial [Planctomycetota bacterium]|nr:NAD-dependent epimerase/dehydratase family protein [Planctomycetota bacterium]